MLIDLFSTNVAYAASGVDSLILNVNRLILNPLISLLFAVAIVYFLYGVFQFLTNAENEEAKTTGRNHMIWGIIGIVIMMGVFTILQIVMDTFNIGDGIDLRRGTVQLEDYTPPDSGSLK